MNTVSSNIGAALLSTLIAVSPLRLLPTTLQYQAMKTWEFKLHQGSVIIDLMVHSSHPQVSSLGILYENDAHPSLAEEANFIREVLQQLPAIGVDPHSLTSIDMPGFAEPEVMRQVAIAALHSKAWHDPSKTTGGAERLLEDLLNSLRVYDAFNASLEGYGLRVQAVGAEKVASVKCLDLRMPDLPCSVHNNPRVPTGANLTLILERKDAAQAQ